MKALALMCISCRIHTMDVCCQQLLLKQIVSFEKRNVGAEHWLGMAAIALLLQLLDQ